MWYIIRFYAIALIPSFLVDTEAIFLITGLSFLHAKSGLESIVCDYVHNFNTQLVFLLFLRLISLKTTFCIVELFL